MRIEYGGIEMIANEDDGVVELTMEDSNWPVSREFCGAGGCPHKPQLSMLIHLLQTVEAHLKTKALLQARAGAAPPSEASR
jgi:hypothetical protein